MTITTTQKKGPAEAATSPSHGSRNPSRKAKSMNAESHNTSAPATLSLTRRLLLGGAAAVPAAAVAGPAAASAADKAAEPTLEQILASASPEDRARYHANALTDAMAELRPDQYWCNHVQVDEAFCLIIGHKRADDDAGREG